MLQDSNSDVLALTFFFRYEAEKAKMTAEIQARIDAEVTVSSLASWVVEYCRPGSNRKGYRVEACFEKESEK